MFPLSSSSKFLFSPILVYDQGAHLWVFDLTGRKEQEEQTPPVIVPRLQEIERDGGRTRDKWGGGVLQQKLFLYIKPELANVNLAILFSPNWAQVYKSLNPIIQQHQCC